MFSEEACRLINDHDYDDHDEDDHLHHNIDDVVDDDSLKISLKK